MKHGVRWAGFILVSLIVGGLRLPTTAQPYDFSGVEALLPPGRITNLYGGSVIVLLERGGGEIYRFEHGDLTTTTRRPIASATKWYSAAIVLRLAEAGWFKLDDPIGTHLPNFTNFVSNGFNKGDITIRQCFAMNSGLVETNEEYETAWNLTLAESVELIASNTPVVFEPGTQLAYEGDGMQIVGRICEVATGKDWRALAEEQLFTPLGMTSSDYLAFLFNPGIAGGARSTVEDYLRFLRMILNNGAGPDGHVFLSSRAVQEFFVNQTEGLPEYHSPAPVYGGYPYGQRPDYGMGSWIFAQNPTNGLAEEVASPAAFGAWPWVDRRRNLCGIIFMYRLNGYTLTAYNDLEILAAIRAEVDRVGPPPPPAPAPLSMGLIDNHPFLQWTTNGTLYWSGNLTDWTSMPWARSPFYESRSGDFGGQGFYRLEP